MRICYLDAFSGVSGDMFVGALVDAGADTEALRRSLESLGTGATFEFERTRRAGLGASKFRVVVQDEAKHRHLPKILDIIERGDLPERAKERAKTVFQNLGAAEAAVHQVPIEKVHFHEVGAADSIADIVATCVGLDLLGVERVHCSPLNLGSGTVETEHGTLPVPAPATASLVARCPVYAHGPRAELTTPTGAALASTLAHEFGVMPAIRISAIGYGAGDRDFKEQANVLRILIGETSDLPWTGMTS